MCFHVRLATTWLMAVSETPYFRANRARVLPWARAARISRTFLSFNFALECCSPWRFARVAFIMFSVREKVLRWRTHSLFPHRSVTKSPVGLPCLSVQANRRT
jgi:hypothetical protein